MQVEYLATVSLPDEGWNVNMLEEVCLEAAKELFLRALKHQEEKLLSEIEGERKGEVRRYLTTRFGLIIFSRQKLKQERDGRDTANF